MDYNHVVGYGYENLRLKRLYREITADWVSVPFFFFGGGDKGPTVRMS